MSRFEDLYRWGPQDALTDEALNKRFKDLDDRLSRAEIIRLGEDEAFTVVLDRVLSRSEGVISDLRAQLVAITDLEWLTARSDTSRTLTEGATFALEIVAEDRALFAPGPYALLSRASTPDDYAVVMTLGYDRAIGQWDVEVHVVVGDPGPHDDWQIAAIAGSTLMQLALRDQGYAARDAAEAAAADVAPKAVAVAAAYAAVMPAAAQAVLDAAAAAASAAAAAASAVSIDGPTIDARLRRLEADAWFYA